MCTRERNRLLKHSRAVSPSPTGRRQAVGGVLFSVALLWMWEERLRARELRLWWEQQQQLLQLQEARQRQHEARRLGQRGRQRGAGPASEQQAARNATLCSLPSTQPVPALHITLWLAASSVLCWCLLEALLL